MTITEQPPTPPTALPASRSADTDPVWSNPWLSVRYVDFVDAHGNLRQHSVVRSGSGKGSVVIPRRVVRGQAFFGCVEIERAPLGGRSSIEFPRGGTADLSADEAARELVEETGLTARSTALLGTVHPDTGLLDTEVAVWLAFLGATDASDGFLDPETGSRFRWLSYGEFVGALRAGRIRCGLTLAAWGLFTSSQYDVVPE